MKKIPVILFFLVLTVSSKATTYYSVRNGNWADTDLWSSVCSTCTGGALPVLGSNDIVIIDDQVTISGGPLVIAPTVTIIIRTDNSPNTSLLPASLKFVSGGKLELTSASSKVILQNVTGVTANNPVIDGTGSGNSNIISIGGDVYWTTADGDLKGVGTLNPDGTLPIKLLSFEATNLESSIQLTWITTMEKNFSHFIVERASENLNFIPVSEIDGKGGMQATTAYDYLDLSPRNGKNYYRLKSVDYDMSYEYSPVVLVVFQGNQEVVVYPNPSQSQQIRLKMNFQLQENAQIEVYNNLGVKLTQYSISQLGNEVNLPELKAGSYLLRVTSGSFSQVVRFSVI